jgi:hypothetical protein
MEAPMTTKRNIERTPEDRKRFSEDMARIAAAMTTKPTAQHTLNELFTKHLIALHAAIDKVQPLADYRGNVSALHAIVILDAALADVTRDIAPFSSGAAIRDAAPEMVALLKDLTGAVDSNGVPTGTGNHSLWLVARKARALLAKIEP